MKQMKWKHILLGKWNWKRPFTSLTSIYVLLALFAVFCADRFIFQPPSSSYTSSLSGYITIPANHEQTIAGFHLKGRSGFPTILYSHGNAEDIGEIMDVIKPLNERGIGIIAYDYPGYGLSQGKPTEESTQQAIESVWNYAIRSGIDPASIILFGRSIGSGPSVWLASHQKAGALILLSPMKSVYSVPFHYSIFPKDRFPNFQRIQSIHLPLLVIHGEQDDTIPFSHGLGLYQVSPSKVKSFLPLPEASHNDLFDCYPEEIYDAISTFIQQLPESKR